MLRAIGWSLGDVGWLHRLGSRVPIVRLAASRLLGEIPHGPPGIQAVGHRRYVGGRWRRAGRWQLELMRQQGLRPDHYLLDIGCGALRGGVHFIRYLEPGHYLGVDKETLLIEAGVERELGRDLYELKRPRLLVSSDFEFDSLAASPDFALAQSVFTHLPPPLIERCLSRLRAVVPTGAVLVATYHESTREVANAPHPHDHRAFRYTRREMAAFGVSCGWRMADWNGRGHPRGQSIARYVPV
jgi:SAM-dependent methyltransferase